MGAHAGHSGGGVTILNPLVIELLSLLVTLVFFAPPQETIYPWWPKVSNSTPAYLINLKRYLCLHVFLPG